MKINQFHEINKTLTQWKKRHATANYPIVIIICFPLDMTYYDIYMHVNNIPL
jgi:hypothetical protein